MGVKGFANLLREFAPDAIKPRTIAFYRGKTLAIDVSCFLNRFIYGPDPHPARVQQGLYRLAIQLEHYNIKPIFVFDGSDRIIEKQRETQKRELAKLKIRQSLQLEKNRKVRLREIKGSAQLLHGYSTEQISHILENVKLDEALQCWEEEEQQRQETERNHQQDTDRGAMEAVTHARLLHVGPQDESELGVGDKERRAIKRDEETSQNLRQMIKHVLPQELDQAEDAVNHDVQEDGIDVNSKIKMTIDEDVEEDSLVAPQPDRLISDGGMATMEKLDDFEERDAFIRQKVQSALVNFVRVMDGNQQHLEEMEHLTSRKQKILHQLELDLVQQIKSLPGGGFGIQHTSNQPTAIVPSEVEDATSSLETSTSLSPGKDDVVEDTILGEDKSDEVDVGSSVHVSSRLNVEPLGDMHLAFEDALGSEPIDDASERPVQSGPAAVGQTIREVLSSHESIYWSLERRSIRITRPLVLSCQQLLDAMGQAWIEANDAEAESVCAQLTTRGIADGTVSEDSDTAVFGDGVWIRHFGSKAKGIVEINPVVARRQLDITRNAFRDLCILCGTDFSETIEGIGPKRAVRLIKYYGSIESIMANAGYKPREFFLYDHARRVFDRTPSIPEDMAVYQRRLPKEDLLQKLMQKYDIQPDEVLREVLEEIEMDETKAVLSSESQGTNDERIVKGNPNFQTYSHDLNGTLGLKAWGTSNPEDTFSLE